MKTLTLIHLVDLRVIGGVERMLVDFIRHAPDVAHHVLMLDKHVHPQIQAALSDLPQVHQVVSGKHWRGLRLPKAWRAWRRARWVNACQPDVLLNWSYVTDMRSIQVPCVFYEHGSAWDDYPPEQMRQCFAPVRQVIAVSVAAQQMLRLKHGIERASEVVLNTLRQMPPVVPHARTLPLDRPIVIGAAGRLVARKGFDVLIRAAGLLRAQGVALEVRIAGTGEQQADLQRLIAQLQLEDTVQLLGFVADMGGFYQGLDVSVCPSIWESYGLVAIEAFAYGLPVVGADTDGLPEVVTDGVNGLCITPRWGAAAYQDETGVQAAFAGLQSYDRHSGQLRPQRALAPKDLADALADLFSDAKRYEAMSAAAYATAAQAKPFQALTDEVLTILKAVSHAHQHA